MKIELRPIQEKDAMAVYDLFQSIPSENGFENHSHSLSQTDFAEWVKTADLQSKGIGLKEGRVPQTTSVLWIDNEPVGFSKLRHYLTPALEQHGGHIGFSTGSKFRGKGYANILLAETLKQAKSMGIEKVLLTCNDNNAPSWKTIEHNGGILSKTEIDQKDGRLSRFYWITL
ncbi:MAG: GNAT family N-acetyltransferase [Alphaproteobacteria bacterium]|nr:GNAT family N-acetyltransferase [Alphaproteobacteria bacterium]